MSVFMRFNFCKRKLKKLFLATLIVLALVLPVWGKTAGPNGYEVFMYKDEDPSVPTTEFSPADRIFVRIILKNLPRGDYTFHADWYNALGDLQDSSRYRFTILKKTAEIIESQLKITEASPLRRLFSASEATGYHIKFYGKWHVKLYLNGEELGSKYFTVR